MSRSRKKPIVTITNKIDKDIAHKAVRKKVKMELLKDDPDIYIIEADAKELGLSDWGTKLGWDSSKITSSDTDDDIEEKQKLSRK